MMTKRHFPPGVLLFKEESGVIVDCTEGVDDRSIARMPQIVLVERSTAIAIEPLEDVNGNLQMLPRDRPLVEVFL